MRTLSYLGRGWWGGVAGSFKKADDAIRIHGKENVTRIGPGVWLITKNNEPHQLLLMQRDEASSKKVRVRTTAKAKAIAIPVIKSKALAAQSAGDKKACKATGKASGKECKSGGKCTKPCAKKMR
jgi:hypothetical protein